MMNAQAKGICSGRVIIVTGAGSGLGASYAKALAEEGARVVVNDINIDAAQTTVNDIVAKGGVAVVNSSNITDYSDSKSVVQQAVSVFGALHGVVNNAGICRDRMFASLTEADWDAVISVHLKGHFCISSHAVHYWRDLSKQGHQVNARIVNTSSGAGLNGSIGQSNYAAAKGGIASLTINQAAELGRYGVMVNALAPAARTGMTETVFADTMRKPEGDAFDYFDPANVAPLVVWLCSEASEGITGRMFEVAGGRISIADGWRSTQGVDKGARWLPSEIASAMDELLTHEIPAQTVYGL